MPRISQVLIHADPRFELWVRKECFVARMADGVTDQWFVPDQEDLFVLPLNGLVKLALEYYERLRPQLGDVYGPDIGSDGEIWL